MSARLTQVMAHLVPSETAAVGGASASLFETVAEAPEDAIFGLDLAYKRDPSPLKLNLGVGAYRTDEGAPYLLNVVQKVEAELVATKANHEYLPIDGEVQYYAAANRLMYGSDSEALASGRVAACQGVGGTGALRLAAAFIRKFLPNRSILIPRPTWGNHNAIFSNEGVKVLEYAYYYPPTRGLDLDGMLRDISAAPDGSIILLHACAHNPTGVDPTLDEWEQILNVIQSKNHVTLFDCAYQGFATGDLDNDVRPVRLFVSRGLELFVCQSFSKNLGLYGERTGCVSVVCSTPEHAKRVQSQLKIIVRSMYSNPPIHGARIASRVLNDPALFAEWVGELKVMSGRLREMRERLYAALVANGTPGDWTHILKQIGMFTYTGLTPPQVKLLVEKYHIYLLANGRISMAGIKSQDCQYLADAIFDAVTTHPNQ